MATFDSVKRSLRRATRWAKLKVAERVLKESLKFVPVDEGDLRDSHEIVSKGGSIFVSTGTGIDYAQAQYGGQLRKKSKIEQHLKEGDGVGRIRGKFGGSYSQAYREAIAAGSLTRYEGGLQWFNRVLQDRPFLRVLSNVYVNEVKVRLK